MIILNDHPLIKKFNFSSIITENDNEAACQTIKSIIDSGQYFENSPKFQTKENIFSRSEEFWLKYRMSFLFSVFMYCGRELRVNNMMAWSFMTSMQGAEDREKLWHNHWHPSNEKCDMLSGVLYLKIPSDVENFDLCGTEFAPQGLENSERIFIKPDLFSWIIYPSKLWHRPGIVQSDNFRFVLAADVEVSI